MSPEKRVSIDDKVEESQDISVIEGLSLPVEQPLVEHHIETAAVPETILPLPVSEEIHASTPPITPTEVQQTSICQLRRSEGPSSPCAAHMDNTEQEEVKSIRQEDVGLKENDHKLDDALNQRQEEEEEETHGEAESKEEEEESKDGEDNRKEEEEEGKEQEGKEQEGNEQEGNEQEGKEQEKPQEEMENKEEMEAKEEMETKVMECGEGEENKKEETDINPVVDDDRQEKHSSPQGQDDQTSLGNNAELDMDTESEIAATPAPETAISPSSLNPVEAVDDEHTSGDEPVVFTRRMYYFLKKTYVEYSY